MNHSQEGSHYQRCFRVVRMLQFQRSLLGAALSCFLSAAALAQGLLPTAPGNPPPPPNDFDARFAAQLESATALTPSPIRSGGRVAGCAVNFQGVARDHVNRRGGVVAVVGSVTIFARPPADLYWAVKVVPNDLTSGGAGQIEWRPFTPSSAWVRVGRFGSSEHEQAPFECEGGGFCAAGVGGMTQLAEALPTRRLEVGIQRRQSGLDFTLSFDPSRLATSTDGGTVFNQCMRELLENLGRG